MKLFLMVLVSVVALYAQENTHTWKPLIVNDKERMWYDQAMTDSMKGDKMTVWIMQLYKPPLTAEGINGPIYRSKTLYAINLKSVKYGILNVVYYDAKGKEMNNFKYNINDYPEDLKYTYPITESSFLYNLVKEVFMRRNNKPK
jgi:hypothetical protein